MRESFSEQLSTWRKANNIKTFKEYAESHKVVVNDKDSGVWAYVHPHSTMHINNEVAVKNYLLYKKTVMELTANMQQYSEEVKIQAQNAIESVSKKFYEWLRYATGNEFVVVADGVEGTALKCYLYPIKADGRLYNVSFAKLGDKEYIPVCVIPFGKKERTK